MKIIKLFTLFFPAILFITDRLIKYFAPSINIEGGFVNFGFYKNFAGAFSLPIAGSLYNMAGIIFVFLFFCFSVSAIKNKKFIEAVACEFIFFGGLSNLFDRLSYGYAIDYVDFMNFSFFNLADAMLIAGTFIFLFFHFKRYEA